MSGTKRPLDSGRRDSAGRTIRVSDTASESRSDAPTPPVSEPAALTPYEQKRLAVQAANARNERGWRAAKAWERGERDTLRPSEVLRAAAYAGWAGHRRQVAEIFVGSLQRPWLEGNRNVPYQRWVGGEEVQYDGYSRMEGQTRETLEHDKAIELLGRYRRFVDHMNEARHDWEAVTLTTEGDNATEVVERSRLTGEERRRTLVGPGEFTSYTHTFEINEAGKVVRKDTGQPV